MKHSSFRAFVAVLLLAAGLQSSAQSPALLGLGPGTPSSLKVTLKSAALQQRTRGPFDNIVVSTPYTLDVVGGPSQVGGEFTSTPFRIGTFTGIQFVLDENATYSGLDPCKGGDKNNPADLVTDQPIKLADDGASDLTVTYEQPHPVTGLAFGALPMDPFTLDSSTPVDMQLIFPVTNSLVCLSDTPPKLSASGIETLIATPFGLAVDTTHAQYIISSNLTNTVTAVDRAMMESSTDPDIPAIYFITGDQTQLNGPTGIALDTSASTSDPLILVANSGSDTIPSSITGYQWSAVSDPTQNPDGNVAPTRTISGPTTQLDGPAGMFMDTVNNYLVVANAGTHSSPSINFYPESAVADTTASGDIAPTYTITGADTGLNRPCGVYVGYVPGVTTAADVYVTNNGSNSITVYQIDETNLGGNVTDKQPARTIQGAKTGLFGPCGIDLYDPDSATGQPTIAVASSLNSRVLFFDTMDDGNVYPFRQMQGGQTLISGPTGLKVDANNNEIAVISSGGLTRGNIAVRNLNDATPHMTDPPVLVNSITQQRILVNYVFNGEVDGTGPPGPAPAILNTDPYTGVPLPTQSAGYNFMWRIYDSNLRQEGNATNARLIPPPNVVLGLDMDSNTLAHPLTEVSNLELGCPSFTPFIILTLSTNCSLPLITTPYPPQSAPDYRLIAALFGQPVIKKLPLNVAPLTLNEMPHLNPTVTLDPSGSKAIDGLTWTYVDGNNAPMPPPFFDTQSVSIHLTSPISDVNPCYKQVTGNAGTLVYSSPTLGADARDLQPIQNNRCPIYLTDVATITLTATDALGNRYNYNLKPSL